MHFYDRDLLVATQVAYYHFDYELLKRNKYEISLREIFQEDHTIQEKLEHTFLKAEDKGDPYRISRARHALQLYHEIASPGSWYGSWIIRNIKDDNDSSGFYGCFIDTGGNSGIIAFRGSESTDARQIQKDWIEADLGLLNSPLTNQQKAAAEYMAEIQGRFTCENYGVTGHSLGGNLAVHGAVCSPLKMKGKIGKCVSFDGPGFSKEYLRVHEEEIEVMRGKFIRYQWSLVGNLLYSPSGALEMSVRTDKLVYENYELEALLQKHDTGFVRFYQNGNVMPGGMDSFARQVGKLSRSIDDSPDWVGNLLVHSISKIILLPEEERKRASVMVLNSLTALGMKYPLPSVLGMTAVAAFILVGNLDPGFFGKILIPSLCKAVSGTLETGDILTNALKKSMEIVMNSGGGAGMPADKMYSQILYAVPELYPGQELLL